MPKHSPRCKKHSFLPQTLADWCIMKPSHHIDVVKSNNLPTAAEFKVAEKQIACALKDLACLDHEMQRLAHLRRSLSEMIDTQRSIYAPLRMLPQEALAHVFSFCIWDGSAPADDAPRTLITTTTPAEELLKLSLVCKKWKDIVASSPRLWQNIIINSSGTPGAVASRHIRYSGNCRLTARIGPTSSLEHEVSAWKKLSSAKGRLERLYFEPSTLTIQDLRPVISAGLPVLKVLHLTCDHKAMPTYVLQCFSHVPCLEDLTLKLDHPLAFVDRLLQTSPWRQLMKLSIDRVPFDALLPILTATPNLVACKFCLASDRDASQLPDRISTKLRLEKLSAVELKLNETNQTKILDVLVAPALLDLKLATWRSYFADTLDLGPVSDFLRRSGCNVKKLSLTISPKTVDSAFDILKNSASLEHVSLEYFSENSFDACVDLNPLFLLLTLNSAQPENIISPLLKTLTLA